MLLLEMPELFLNLCLFIVVDDAMAVVVSIVAAVVDEASLLPLL